MSYFVKILLLPSLIFSLTLALAGESAADDLYLQSQDIPDAMSPDTMAREALLDTLYYNYEKWIPAFKQEISLFESRPQTLETQLQLMKYYFYYGGLLVEFSHTLVTTRKYKVPELETEHIAYLNKAKHAARAVLKSGELSRQQEADAYFCLGAAEGYLGILEYGVGNYVSAFTNGFQADGHLEKSLQINPNLMDVNLGLGVYRYATSRVGGLGNLIMQWGRDRRHDGILLIEKTLQAKTLTMPLTYKTLIWFYISEQINPLNINLPPDNPLSVSASRKHAVELMTEMESLYFKAPPSPDFIGSKDLALMKAIQNALDNNYTSAREEFEKVITISTYLRDKKKYKINPKLIRTAEMGVAFSEVFMSSAQDRAHHDPSLCAKIKRQIAFIDGGESIVEPESKGVRREMQNIFYHKLVDLYHHMGCQ